VGLRKSRIFCQKEEGHRGWRGVHAQRKGKPDGYSAAKKPTGPEREEKPALLFKGKKIGIISRRTPAPQKKKKLSKKGLSLMRRKRESDLTTWKKGLVKDADKEKPSFWGRDCATIETGRVIGQRRWKSAGVSRKKKRITGFREKESRSVFGKKRKKTIVRGEKSPFEKGAERFHIGGRGESTATSPKNEPKTGDLAYRRKLRKRFRPREEEK